MGKLSCDSNSDFGKINTVGYGYKDSSEFCINNATPLLYMNVIQLIVFIKIDKELAKRNSNRGFNVWVETEWTLNIFLICEFNWSPASLSLGVFSPLQSQVE